MSQRIVGAAIRGTGLAVPKLAVTNEDLEKIVDTTDEWIVQRTGIKTRHRSQYPGELTQLATDATRLQPRRVELVEHAIAPEQPGTFCYPKRRILDNRERWQPAYQVFPSAPGRNRTCDARFRKPFQAVLSGSQRPPSAV